LIWYVLEQLRSRINNGMWRPGKHACIGHATRLTLFSPDEWARLSNFIKDHSLPVTLVGLPQSDMYMMGRGSDYPRRTTLDVPKIAKEHQMKVAMAVNNVDNAFTPQGPVDPLALCPLGVALFQTCTFEDCHSMVEAITTTARQAIGATSFQGLMPQIGDPAEFVILHENDSLQSVVCNPGYDRTTIYRGEVVAKRSSTNWNSFQRKG